MDPGGPKSQFRSQIGSVRSKSRLTLRMVETTGSGQHRFTGRGLRSPALSCQNYDPASCALAWVASGNQDSTKSADPQLCICGPRTQISAIRNGCTENIWEDLFSASAFRYSNWSCLCCTPSTTFRATEKRPLRDQLKVNPN